MIRNCMSNIPFWLTHWDRVTHTCVSNVTSFVQIMDCRLFGDKSLSEQKLECFNSTLVDRLQWHFNRISYIFTHEHAFKHVLWKLATVSSRPQYAAWFIIRNTQTKCIYPLSLVTLETYVDILRLRQNGRYCADDIFNHIFMNEKCFIFINISSKFVPRGSVNNIPVLVQMIAWCRQVTSHYLNPWYPSLLMHTCVTRPQ